MKKKDLKDFERFIIQKKNEVNNNTNVWSYTRVSSKEQSDNYSLNIQKHEAHQYATQNKYIISKEFGGTYESASKDMSRKEFSRLLEEVKKTKNKPFAILLYKANRFSRTGGHAIGLVDKLIFEYKVHLIETTTGLTTITARERLAFYNKLLDATKENLDRLDITIPGMKAFLNNGYVFGKVPRGYIQFGPRVKDPKRVRGIQKIVLSNEGKQLRKAWAMKLDGYNDPQISKILSSWGIKGITEKFLTRFWRRPFYCGINTNRMLDKPIQGKWEAMVSIEDFRRVQEIVNQHKRGYKIIKGDENRPLIGTLLCPLCKRKLTGYKNKLKQIHYYKCQKCNGISINAINTPFARGLSAYTMFAELLDKIAEPFYNEDIESRITLTLNEILNNSKSQETILIAQQNDLKSKLEMIEKKYVYNEITKFQYEKYSLELENQIMKINEEIENALIKISNSEIKIKKQIKFAQNLSKIWVNGNLQIKRGLQKMMFPTGLVIDTKKRKYLTPIMNEFFAEFSMLTRVNQDKKKRTFNNITENSLMVARARVELATS